MRETLPVPRTDKGVAAICCGTWFTASGAHPRAASILPAVDRMSIPTNDSAKHTMQVIRSKDFNPERAWEALPIAEMNGITTRLHWTDQPYRWHINDGEEVFVVLHGTVDMFYREGGLERSVRLEVGDIFHATAGTEHLARPLGAARVLVIETAGSA